METKLRVAALYIDARDKCDGARPSINAIAKESGVGWHYVEKVETELLDTGEVALPKDIYRTRAYPDSPGARTLDAIDSFVLYALYQKDQQRSLDSYVNHLFYYTGTVVSASVVSRFFLHAFPIKGGLCKPNLVPYDKFRPANIQKAKEYVRILAQLDPTRVKYCDEKSLKGKSIYNKKPRRDIVTGIIPAVLTAPDLRNTYSIIGICSIDRRTTPVRFRITDITVNAELFAMEIEAAVATKFLTPGDVLVMDNAANHTGKENTVLEDWLWNSHRIFALFLPARAPEWNPIELVWGCLEARLQNYDIKRIKEKKDRVVYASVNILSEITHEEVVSFYKKSGVFNSHDR